MAAQVLSGSGNVSYTNSTGQNVRVVINYLKNTNYEATMTFQGVTVTIPQDQVYGKTLAFKDDYGGGQTGTGLVQVMAAGIQAGASQRTAVPLEIALSNGETLSITNSNSSQWIRGYNMIIIPEAG